MTFHTLQDYLTKTKYYINHNRNGERVQFIKHFEVFNWLSLSDLEKKTNSIS